MYVSIVSPEFVHD